MTGLSAMTWQGKEVGEVTGGGSNQRPHPRCDLGTKARGARPVYSAVGRMRRRFTRCSRMCAAQPAMRAKTKIGVNIGVGTPRKWKAEALKKSRFGKRFFSRFITDSMRSDTA